MAISSAKKVSKNAAAVFVVLKNHYTPLKQKNSLRSNSFCFLTLRFVVFFNAQQPRRSPHFN
jgi:hypothetical protein